MDRSVLPSHQKKICAVWRKKAAASSVVSGEQQPHPPPLKVVYITNPIRFEATAAEFKALVQELTGKDATYGAAGCESPNNHVATAAKPADGGGGGTVYGDTVETRRTRIGEDPDAFGSVLMENDCLGATLLEEYLLLDAAM